MTRDEWGETYDRVTDLGAEVAAEMPTEAIHVIAMLGALALCVGEARHIFADDKIATHHKMHAANKVDEMLTQTLQTLQAMKEGHHA